MGCGLAMQAVVDSVTRIIALAGADRMRDIVLFNVVNRRRDRLLQALCLYRAAIMNNVDDASYWIEGLRERPPALWD